MDVVVSLLAALVATGFTIELALSWRRRPRPHAAIWTVAIGAFALATWALFAGLAFDWTETTFRVFFYLGGIASVPLLAAGSVYLVLGARRGRRFLFAVIVWLALGALALVAAPIDTAIAAVGVPEGSEVFAWTVDALGTTLPGPRFFAALSGIVGTIVIVALAGYSVVKWWRASRRMAVANVLIVLGVLAAASGGSLTALGEGAAFALSLLTAVVLLWAGYRVAVQTREAFPSDEHGAPLGSLGENDSGEDQHATDRQPGL